MALDNNQIYSTLVSIVSALENNKIIWYIICFYHMILTEQISLNLRN